MASDSTWEFKCPQFVDFNDVDKFDPEADSYFDKNNEEGCFCPRNLRKSTVLQQFKEKVNFQFAETENESSPSDARKRSLYTFTAAFNKPKSSNVEDKNKGNPFLLASKMDRKTTFKTSLGLSKASKISLGLSKTSKASKRFLPIRKPLTGMQRAGRPVAILKPSTKIEPKAPASSVAMPQTERRRAPSPSTAPLVRKKLTRPQTPQCLKRSMIKASAKVIKTSEQLELERIAEMRRKMKTDLNINKATMKKARAPALKPMTEKRPVVVPRVESRKNEPAPHQQDKRYDAIFKKPSMFTRAKSFIGFGTRPRQGELVRQNTTPYGLRSSERRITHSDSSTPSVSKLNASTNKTSSALKSLNVCHSGMPFISKQDLKVPNAVKIKPSGQENKNTKVSAPVTPRKRAEIKSKGFGSSVFRSYGVASKTANTSQPLKDRTNSLSSSHRNAVQQKTGLKRMSSDCLIRGKADKRLKIKN